MGWTCPRCRADYAEPRERCDVDGWRLVENLTGQVYGGRYHIDKLVGVGGMKSTVWRAMQQPTGRPVAIKILPATIVEEAQRFERGARIASNLNHPHITTVHDYGTTADGAFYLVMELLEGQTLQGMLKHAAPSLLDTLVIVDQILRALEHAHAANVVHRDLKPANLFLTRKNDDIYFTKILDFGLAKLATAGDEESHDSDGVQKQRPTVELAVDVNNDVTQAQRICGTPEYMAPEQILGAPLDRRTDLYALGVILYRMLSGNLPFRANIRHELYQQHLSSPPPPFLVTQNVPESISRVVMKALAKRPAERFADASEMRLALREANRQIASELGHSFTGLFHTDVPMKTGASSHGSMIAVQRRSKLPWIIAGVALLVAGGLTGVMVGGSGSDQPQAPPIEARATNAPAQTSEPEKAPAPKPSEAPAEPIAAASAPTQPKPAEVAIAPPSTTDKIEAEDPKNVEPPAPRMGKVALATNPEGVEIWHEGRLIGTTPTTIELVEGTRTIELKGKNVKASAIPIAVVADRETPLTLDLQVASSSRAMGRRSDTASRPMPSNEVPAAVVAPAVAPPNVAASKPGVSVLGKDIKQENPSVRILGSDPASEKPKVKVLGP